MQLQISRIIVFTSGNVIPISRISILTRENVIVDVKNSYPENK